MTHNIHRRSFTRIVAMLALTGWLAGCGFKGPLYLPPPKPGTKRPATAPQMPTTQEDADPDSEDANPDSPNQNTTSTAAQTNNKP